MNSVEEDVAPHQETLIHDLLRKPRSEPDITLGSASVPLEKESSKPTPVHVPRPPTRNRQEQGSSVTSLTAYTDLGHATVQVT